MNTYLKFTAIAATLLMGCSSIAQTTAATKVSGAIDPCRSEVSKFDKVIGFVRDTQGEPAAAVLKEKLLPAQLEGQIMTKEGYCGLAKHLRTKKLI